MHAARPFVPTLVLPRVTAEGNQTALDAVERHPFIGAPA
jgi:hypothetical protein